MTNKIYLTGFMGSGKSTIGPILANTLGWEFYDLDHVIEKKEGKKISRIFDENGEEYFRNLEKELLKALAVKDNIVIALGGGTITNQENIDFLKKIGKIIYIKVSAESVYNRLRFKRDRPILIRNGITNLSRAEFIGKIEQLISDRNKYYEQADIIVTTDNSQIGRTIEKLLKAVKTVK
jgi:shikimate kinase